MKKNNFQHLNDLRDKGFSIVEMVLYAGLLTLFLVVLSNLFLTSLDVKTASEGDSYTGQDARFIVSRLTYDLKRTDNIISPALGASAGSLTLSIGGVSYTYAFGSDNLTLTDATGTYNLNSSESTISNVSFQRIGNSDAGSKNSIKVAFSVNGQAYTTTIGTR